MLDGTHLLDRRFGRTDLRRHRGQLRHQLYVTQKRAGKEKSGTSVELRAHPWRV